MCYYYKVSLTARPICFRLFFHFVHLFESILKYLLFLYVFKNYFDNSESNDFPWQYRPSTLAAHHGAASGYHRGYHHHWTD